MTDAEEARARIALLLIVGLLLGLPAAVMAAWISDDASWAFWGCVLVAGVCALMVLVSAIAYAVSLGRAARP
ncbi:hypothetical protein [Lapillicoccus sp.]|uniref:hypothetical protein n=1 Tax=Lapillicoccus sp. TaxID=1909287 RepID=UPI0039832448